MNKQELNKKIDYIEQLTDRVIKSLKSYSNEVKDNHIYYFCSNPNRAKFSRLRIELVKELKSLEDCIYGREK